MFSEVLLLYLLSSSYVFILQLIAASFVVSCALWVESCLREDSCLKNCCSFYLDALYASNIKINPAKGVLLDSGLIQTAFTMFIGSLTLCKD